MIDDLADELLLADEIHHRFQFGVEDSSGDVGTVVAVLSRLHREKDLFPEGVGGEGEEDGGLAQGADDGQRVLRLLHIPARSPQDRGRQDDDLTSVVEIVVGGGVDEALVAFRLRLGR